MRISDWSSDVCSSDLRTSQVVANPPQVGRYLSGVVAASRAEPAAHGDKRLVDLMPEFGETEGRIARAPRGTAGAAGRRSAADDRDRARVQVDPVTGRRGVLEDRKRGV